jgi:hypothetical protein
VCVKAALTWVAVSWRHRGGALDFLFFSFVFCFCPPPLSIAFRIFFFLFFFSLSIIRQENQTQTRANETNESAAIKNKKSRSPSSPTCPSFFSLLIGGPHLKGNFLNERHRALIVVGQASIDWI